MKKQTNKQIKCNAIGVWKITDHMLKCSICGNRVHLMDGNAKKGKSHTKQYHGEKQNKLNAKQNETEKKIRTKTQNKKQYQEITRSCIPQAKHIVT